MTRRSGRGGVTGRALVGAVLISLAAAGCGKGRDDQSGSEGPRTTITVFAAASLTEAFTAVGRQFESANGTKVSFSFGASSSLAQQVANGAPADVLATADEQSMRRVADRLAQPAIVFAHNRLAVVVRRGNPKGIGSLADLARPDVIVVLCAPEVPCGRFGAQATSRAGVEVRARSLEPDVKGVVSKVSLGEADAGIAYVTDIRPAAGQLEEVTIPPEHNVVARYPIAPLRGSKSPESAKAFADFVPSLSGRAALDKAGFQAP